MFMRSGDYFVLGCCWGGVCEGFILGGSCVI